MDDWKCKSKWVRNISAGVHESLSASIDFDHALPFIARQNSFDSYALLTVNPLRLDERSFAHNLSAFEEVPVGVTVECRRLDFCSTFDICWN